MSMLSIPVQAHVPPSKRATTHKGVFARFYQRLYEARMQKAHDLLKQQSHLLPSELRQAALDLAARNEKSLPFIR